MDKQTRNARIATKAEDTLKRIHALRQPSAVLNGLADRPRPGQKAAARQAFVEMLKELNELRLEIERTKPLRLVLSGNQDSNEPDQATSKGDLIR